MVDLPAWTRRLGPRQLQMLLVIAQTGSLSRTAELMATTQPGLSKWLKDLESSLGVVLFDRTTRRLAPTEYGHIVLRLAEQVLGDARRMHDEIEARKAGHLGRIKLGVLPGLGPALLPDALQAMQERGLGIELALQENTLDVLLPDLHDHRLDLLVARLDRAALNSGATIEPLFEETACVLASVDHPLQGRTQVSWQDLAQQPWILPVVGSPMRHMVESAFERAGLAAPRGLLESASSLTNRAIARRLGCLFVSSQLGADELERDGTLRRLPVPLGNLPTGVGVLWVMQTLAPQHRQVIDALHLAVRRRGLRQLAVAATPPLHQDELIAAMRRQ